MSYLLEFKDLIQKNLFSIMGILINLVVLYGIVQFSISAILPALDAQSKLSAQVNQAQNSLVDTRASQNEPAAKVQARLSSAQTKLTSALGYFFTDAQANDFINSLYQNADESDVKITQVETVIANVQPTPPRVVPSPTRAIPTLIPSSASSSAITSTKAPPPSLPLSTPTVQPSATKNISSSVSISTASKNDFSARLIRLQVQGASHQLLEFVSRIKALNARAILINGMTISGDENISTLSLELAVYVAPPILVSKPDVTTMLSGSGSKSGAVAASPTTQPTATSLPLPTSTSTAIPTASPGLPPQTVSVQRYSIHVVLQGETLNTIARQYGITVEAIRTANRMMSDEIRPAQQLFIPIR